MYNPRYERSDDYRYQFIKAHPGAFGKFYMCPYCGRIMLRKTMQVDHIVSIHLANKHRAYRILVPNGNINSIHNLTASCPRCNRKKSDSGGFWIFLGRFGIPFYFCIWMLLAFTVWFALQTTTGTLPRGFLLEYLPVSMQGVAQDTANAIADTYTGGVQYAEEKTSESYTSSGMRYIGNGHVLVVLGTCPTSKNADTAVNSVVSSVLESAVPASDDGNITVSGVPMNISNCQVSFTNNLALVKKDGFELRFIPSTYQSDAIAFGLVGTTSSGASVSHGDYASTDGTEVYLIESGAGIEEIVLDKDNGYGTVLKDMPKYRNGVEIDYQIKDFKVDGYTTNIIKGDSVKDFKVTNTHVPEMVTVTVTEGWHDQSDYDKIRPEEIALTLTGSDGNVYEKTVNKETWTAVFSDLPKNSKGEQIIYTLTQEGIKGYSTTITNNQTDTITVINEHEPVKTITVTVTWNDENNKDSIRPDKVTVKLTDGTTVVSTKEVKNDSWKHIFEDIPVFNGSDKVSYTITQDAVNGYTTEIKASDDGNTIEIINTHIPVVPPKEEPKKEEPATPAPVVEVKVEQPAPTVTLIQTTNKPTGISFFESLFAK